MVEFTVCGIPCAGLNGGPGFKHSEAFSMSMKKIDINEAGLARSAHRHGIHAPMRARSHCVPQPIEPMAPG